MTSNVADATSQYPFMNVVSIADTIGGVAHRGAGFMVTTDEVLTAADVVWSSNAGAASAITVTPALNDSSQQPFGQFSVDQFHYLPINDGAGETTFDQQGDFALLHLSQPDSHGTLPISSFFPGGTVHITGYPDAAGGSSMFDTIESVMSDGQGATLPANIPSGSGMDGAPVWWNGNQRVGIPQGVGVVTANDRIALISRPINDLIQQWIAADHSGTATGAIAVSIPPLFQSITPDTGAPGIDPGEAALVDTFSYLSKNPDVAAAAIDPAVHFASFGWHEGRAPDPLFDPTFYLAHNPDVAAAGVDPLLHYALFGWHEGRDPSASFSTSGYLAANPDVRLAGVNPLLHYLDFGVNEGRTLPASRAAE